MRLTIAALVIVGLPAMVAAQFRPTSFGAPFDVPLPLPPIGLPLPRLGLPLAPIGLPPVEVQPGIGRARLDGQRGIGRARPSHHVGDGRRQFVRRAGVPSIVYLVPAYGFDYFPPAQGGTAAPGYFPAPDHQETRPLIGILRLEVEPQAVLQVYVDGYYVGMPADFHGEMPLEAGPHRIEIRAPGYETVQLDVNIAADRSITYRGSLKPEGAPGPAVQTLPDAAPRTPTIFYHIPGCYAGNVPPKDAGLPATCDQSRATIFKP
jgi:PEGA domain-containing protein